MFGEGGEGNCGGGGSGDGGGDNGGDDNGGGDNDNSGSDNDNNGSDNNYNGGNRGDGGGSCNTATSVGIDKEDNNQLKVAMGNGRGRPRGGGRVLTAGAHGFKHILVSFFDFAFCKECGLGTMQSVRKSYFPPKELGPVLNLDILRHVLLERILHYFFRSSPINIDNTMVLGCQK